GQGREAPGRPRRAPLRRRGSRRPGQGHRQRRRYAGQPENRPRAAQGGRHRDARGPDYHRRARGDREGQGRRREGTRQADARRTWRPARLLIYYAMLQRSIIRIVISFLVMVVVVVFLYKSMATMTQNPEVQVQSTVKQPPPKKKP